MRRRAFNGSERAALFLAVGGKCEECGRPLERNWHADHRIPWSKGGATDVTNGRATCPTCNLKKGERMSHVELRGWQEEAFQAYERLNQRDFLCVATPGSGKTFWACIVASEALRKRQVGRVVVVCPSDHLKTQWADEATKHGIELNPKWMSRNVDGEAADFHGIATTYQQVNAGPLVFRKQCADVATLVIFDEIHHAGDGNDWGDSLREAFEPATLRLSLSGTPFREDNRPIPFIRYEDSRSVADFTYGYGDALADNVCRDVLFPSYEGKMQWFNGAGTREASFADDLCDEESRQRLRTALSASGEWLPRVLRDAHVRLCRMREAGHRDAAGLVLAIDQAHARACAKVLAEATGVEPVVVVSEDVDASDKIKRFDAGSAEWIVAVRMVSEGVDIPRLRVLVYATNILSELFFRQAMGRVVRVIKDITDQSAYFFIPAEKELIEFANTVKRERDHELEVEESRKPGEREASQVSLYAPISAEARPHDVIVDAEHVTQTELAHVQALVVAAGMRLVPALEQFALLLRVHDRQRLVPAPLVAAPAEQEPHYQRRAKAKRLLTRLANRYVEASGLEHRDVYYRLQVAGDGSPQGNATLEEIEHRIEIVKGWFSGAR